MTVTAQTPFTEYIAAPGATTFATTFRLIELGDLVVTVNGAIVTSGFAVGGLPLGPTASVLFTTPMAGGESIKLQRIVKLERQNSYQFEGDFQANVVNQDFDRLWMSQQEQAFQLKAIDLEASLRNLRAPVGEVLSEMPIAATRANKLLAFDATGLVPVFVLPGAGIGGDITAANLGNAVDPLLGSNLVGFRPLTQYTDNLKIGFWLKQLLPKNAVTGNLKAEFVFDNAPLNYGSTRASFVVQHRDAANGGLDELIPGTLDQFNFTGNGVVTAGIEQSRTIWQGRMSNTNKTGDGSAHGFTVGGELRAVGPGGYNELGGYQGELTNTGSVLGTMSGFEFYLKDSPNGGINSYSTKMQGCAVRIAKHHPTLRKSYSFFASSEGSVPINGVIGINYPGGAAFQRGIDFEGAVFTSGQSILNPNNTNIGWLTSTGVSVAIMGVSTTNSTYIRAASASNTLDLSDFAGTPRFQIHPTGVVSFINQNLSATATTGANVLPANPAFFLNVLVNGSMVKIPCYNA